MRDGRVGLLSSPCNGLDAHGNRRDSFFCLDRTVQDRTGQDRNGWNGWNPVKSVPSVSQSINQSINRSIHCLARRTPPDNQIRSDSTQLRSDQIREPVLSRLVRYRKGAWCGGVCGAAMQMRCDAILPQPPTSSILCLLARSLACLLAGLVNNFLGRCNSPAAGWSFGSGRRRSHSTTSHSQVLPWGLDLGIELDLNLIWEISARSSRLSFVCCCYLQTAGPNWHRMNFAATFCVEGGGWAGSI
jgi:hypothetical protein